MKKIIKKTVVLFLFILLFLNKPCFALDWKRLHDKANGLSLKEAIELANSNPNDVNITYILGLCYFNLHLDQKAKKQFDKALDNDSTLIEAIWGVAEYERRIYDYDNAEKKLNRIIKIMPEFSPAYITLAYIKYMQCEFEEVVRLMGIVINFGTKGNDLMSLVRAHCIYAGGKGMIAYYGGPLSKFLNGPAVFKHLKIAQTLDKNNVAVDFGFGCYYLLRPGKKSRDLNKAEKYLKSAINKDPLFADCYVRLSQVYSLKGDEEKAQFYLNKAIEIDPKNILAADIINNECKFICDWKEDR